MCTGSALLKDNQQRLLKYKKLAVAFSYPDESLRTFFPDLSTQKETLALEYDHLFRNSGIWLYAAEYTAENEFQRAKTLADINGFYRAFGLTPDKDRPDALPCELEFMHYLIFKEINAPSKEKALICSSAQKKFLAQHLYPAAKAIVDKIIEQTKNDFYKDAAQEMLRFLEAERSL